jgi:hypothetical protein
VVKLKHAVIAGFVLLAGILAVYYLLPSEEKKVKKRFDLLSQYVSKEPGEDLFSMANRVKNIGSLFADPSEFKVEGDPFYSFSGSYSRGEISAYALRGRSYFSRLSLKFHDLKIEFPESGTARVDFTARLTGKSMGGEDVDEPREMRSVLKKVEKNWLFSGFEVVEVLKK